MGRWHVYIRAAWLLMRLPYARPAAQPDTWLRLRCAAVLGEAQLSDDEMSQVVRINCWGMPRSEFAISVLRQEPSQAIVGTYAPCVYMGRHVPYGPGLAKCPPYRTACWCKAPSCCRSLVAHGKRCDLSVHSSRVQPTSLFNLPHVCRERAFAGLWPEFSLVNHSCAPNTVAFIVGTNILVQVQHFPAWSTCGVWRASLVHLS